MRTVHASWMPLLVAVTAASLSAGYMRSTAPQRVMFDLPVPELDNARSYVWARVNDYRAEWDAKLPDTDQGLMADFALKRWFNNDLGALRHYLVYKAPRGHFGWEKVAVAGFRGSMFQAPTCAPTAFPGAVGHGKRTLRCYINGPTRRPVTNLYHIGGPNGSGGCSAPGDSISMQPGGIVCEFRGRTGFRFITPTVCGTRGLTVFGNGFRVESDTGGGFNNDSLIWVGVPAGAPANCRYDTRVPSFLTTNAQGYWDFRQKHMWFGYSTTWDEQCSSTPCSPSEGKGLRVAEGAGTNADSAYFYRNEFIGNSGDDVGTIASSYSTIHETWFGPTQDGGGQASCLTTGNGWATNITWYRSACIEGNHRTPLPCGTRLEFAEYLITGWVGRNWEVNSCADSVQVNLFSVLMIRSKTTNTDKVDNWLNGRPNARIAGIGPPDVHVGEAVQDSGWSRYYVDEVAQDTSWNDGYQLAFYTPGTTSPSGGSERSFYADLPAAICDLGGAFGGDVSFGTNCDDTSGIQIDTTDFKSATPLGPTSDIADIFGPPDSVKARLLDRKLVGNRFRWNCSWEIVDSLAHNAFVDSMFTIATAQTYPSTVPGSTPDSMEAWYPGYPTVSGMAADSTLDPSSGCTLNPNGVEDSLAVKITTAFGGTPDNITLEDDADGDGYPLFAEMFALTDPTVANDSTGAESSASNTHSSGLDVHLCALSTESGGRFRAAYSCVDSGAIGAWIVNVSGSEGLFFNNTGAALAATASLLDSAQVDSICALRHWRCPPILWWNVQWPNEDDNDLLEAPDMLGLLGPMKPEEGWN